MVGADLYLNWSLLLILMTIHTWEADIDGVIGSRPLLPFFFPAAPFDGQLACGYECIVVFSPKVPDLLSFVSTYDTPRTYV